MNNPDPKTTSAYARLLELDTLWAERCERCPEEGPRLLFFSGGSALREVSRALRRYTHNSIHLVTPFDSGGSTAALREAFQIFGVGDLRNRLVALAGGGAASVETLFAHRFPEQADAADLRRQLSQLVAGKHPLLQGVAGAEWEVIGSMLGALLYALPTDFDLRGASLGNLILVGGYLRNDRELDPVLELISSLIQVQGTARPTSVCDAHLVATHARGQRVVGQHLFRAANGSVLGPISNLELSPGLDGAGCSPVPADPAALELIDSAELICYPVGSFFSSVLANLLPVGVGEHLARRDCPKVFIPNSGHDPEMAGYTLSQAIAKLVEFVRRDAGKDTPVERILDHVLVDPAHMNYQVELDLEAVAGLGVSILEAPLGRGDPDRVDPDGLVRCLLSIRT